MVPALLDEPQSPLIALNGGGALPAAGKDQHLHLIQIQILVQFLQSLVGLNYDAVTAGHLTARQAHQGHLDARPPQQVGRSQRLRLFKTLAQ